MTNNDQNQKLADQVSQLIKKYGASPQLFIRMGTPAVAVATPVVAAAPRVALNFLDDGFHNRFQTEKQLINSAHELNNIQDKKNLVMPNINNLLAQREKFLTQN